MSKRVKAPVYTPKGYAYWANYFASPAQIAETALRAQGSPTGTTPVGGSDRNSLANINKDIKSITGQVATTNLIRTNSTKGISREDLDPKVRTLYDTLAKNEVHGEPGFLERVVDLLSRPIYAVANAYEATIKEEQAKNGGTDINDLAYIPFVGPSFWRALSQGEELWDGFAGYDKRYFSDVLETAHPDMNDVAQGVLGFALDVFMDPTTYIGGTGLLKSSGKVAAKGAEIAADAIMPAEKIADVFKADPSRIEKVRDIIAKEYDAQGLNTQTNFMDEIKAIDALDFTSADDIKSFLSSRVGNAEVANDVSKSGRALRASNQRAVSIFLQSTQKVLHDTILTRAADDLLEQAKIDGSFIDPTVLHPDLVLRVPKYEAMTMPQAEVAGKITELYAERGRIGSLMSKANVAGNKEAYGKLQSQYKRVQAEIDKLVEEVPINMKDDNVRKAIIEVMGNGEYNALKARIAKITEELAGYNIGVPHSGKKVIPGITAWRNSEEMLEWARGQIKHEMDAGGGSHLSPTVMAPKRRPGQVKGDIIRPHTINNIPMSPERWLLKAVHPFPGVQKYYKKLLEREALEAKRSKMIADAALRATNDLNLPEGARLQKYRSMKDWRNVVNEYMRIYLGERKATKAADVAAETAHAAGDTAKTVAAISAKAASGKANGANVNKALENARRELQWRISEGQLTVDDLRAFLRENKINAPDLLHDLMDLPGKGSRILHLGDELNTTAKRLNVDRDALKDILKNNDIVTRQIAVDAQKFADEAVEHIMATALDVMARSMSLEARKAFGLKIGLFGNGPVVASFATPELISQALNKLAKTDPAKSGIEIFNKILVSSAGLDKDIARLRAREAGRATELIKINGARIYETFSKIPPDERRQAWEQLTNPTIKVYTNPEVVEAFRYELKIIAEKFGENAFPGLRDPLTLSEVNAWIPNRKKLKNNKVEAWQIEGGHLPADDDPVEWLLNALKKHNLNDMDPTQFVWDLQVATEKALARKATIESIVQQFGIATGKNSPVSSYDPITKTLVGKHGYKGHPLARDGFLFDPEIHKQLTKIDDLLRSQQMIDSFGEYAGKITQAWKRTVTVRNPGFHTRNTAGDIFVSWLDGVSGVHGVQSHRMALRTVLRFRNLDDAEDPLVKAMGQPDMIKGYENLKKKAPLPESHKTVLYKKDGVNYTMGDIWSLYVNEGLLSGFANTEFGAVFKSPSGISATKAGQKISAADQAVLRFSESREDVFRLAHFIDVMRRTPIKDVNKAAAEAAARVRKYHFDYSDFTMHEKLIFARVFPFYKWTRKAMPLMIESLFTKPGKMLLVPKASQNMGVALGFGGNSPDVVTPEWITSRFLFPVADGGGSTTYMGVALPYDALKTMGAPGDSLIGMLHPGLKAGLEFAMGERLTGQKIDPGQYAAGLFPQSNMLSKQLSGSGTPEQLAAFLTGLTITQNNSKTINAELMKRSGR